MKTKIYSFFLGVLFTLVLLVAAIIYDRHPSTYGVLERWTKTAWTKAFGPSLDDKAFSICEIPSLPNVPKGSVLIIGHARSDLDDMDDFPGPMVMKLLTEDGKLASHVVFTGDIFAVPSRRKWQKFARFFDEIEAEFLIAPGNHEHLTGDNANRDIFLDQFGAMNLRTLILPKTVLIVQDSTQSNWLFSSDVTDLVTELSAKYPFRKLILLRHNIPVREMLSLANSNIDKAPLIPNADQLAHQFEGRKVTIISGDSGAFSNLPRYSCHKYQNLSFYTNGLGGFGDDFVLILHQGKIWKYAL